MDIILKDFLATSTKAKDQCKWFAQCSKSGSAIHICDLRNKGFPKKCALSVLTINRVITIASMSGEEVMGRVHARASYPSQVIDTHLDNVQA